MGMTMAEKALARASGSDVVQAEEFVTAEIDILMGHDLSFFAGYQVMIENGYDKVWDPDKVVVIIDHAVPAPNIRYAEAHRKIREYVQSQNIENFYDTGVGVCHQVLPEKGHALPGRLIVGGDSHTTTYGALGVASCGIGISDLAYAMAKGSLWFMVPETIRFILNGTLPKGVSAKDIMLKIAGQYTAEVAQYKAVEFTGPAAKALSIDGRMTISNMGVEIGAKFAFFETDDKTLAYLKTRTDQSVEPFGPDPDARYLEEYEIDVSSLEPQIACPHNVDNVKPVSEIGEVSVQQAVLGSCTNARVEDLERAAAILKGKSVNPGTRLLVIPASREINTQIAKSGIIQTILEAGALIAPPSCGSCGGGMGVLAPGETAISSTNRNFKGRMGSPESFVYLGSPETVAASAIEGKIADPRKYVS
ncbi:MAG: 3-isopropylmalate dehydratase large subunit [Desulfobacteraceae bacterium]|nr:3-isopropylmalate dehydratase large subunit [Desulfobacteraceae bacterium]